MELGEVCMNQFEEVVFFFSLQLIRDDCGMYFWFFVFKWSARHFDVVRRVKVTLNTTLLLKHNLTKMSSPHAKIIFLRLIS